MSDPRPSRSAARAGLAALLAFAAASAPAPAAARSGSPSDPVFTALRADGTTAAGRLASLGADGSAVLVDADGEEVALAAGSVIKLTRADGSSVPTEPEPGVLLFPGGDRLHRAAIGPARETTLEVQSFALGALSVPIDSLLGLVVTAPGEARALADLVGRLRDEPRRSEVLWLANGDRLTGGLLGLGDRTVSFKGETGRVELDRAAVRALGFDPGLAEYPEPEGPFWEVTTLDGSRLGLAGTSVDGGQVEGTTRFGARARVALAEVARLHARHPSISYLSGRDEALARYTPYLGPVRPYRRDSAVDGGPLVLGGQAYDRGLGTTSRTLLAYRIEPGDRRFQATVGVDDRAGPLGSVAFRVLVDDREAFRSGPVSAGDTPLEIDVDLSGGKFLILDTEFGERGDVRDLADWVEARILR